MYTHPRLSQQRRNFLGNFQLCSSMYEAIRNRCMWNFHWTVHILSWKFYLLICSARKGCWKSDRICRCLSTCLWINFDCRFVEWETSCRKKESRENKVVFILLVNHKSFNESVDFSSFSSLTATKIKQNWWNILSNYPKRTFGNFLMVKYMENKKIQLCWRLIASW